MRSLMLLALVLLSCRETGLVRKDECDLPCYPTESGGVPGLGVCGNGNWACDDAGTMSCAGATTPTPETCDGLDNDCNGQIDEGVRGCCTNPSPEVCDGKDNDCDGVVDEIDGPPSFCYSGPAGTVGVGECHPGVIKCVNGAIACSGEQIPHQDICNQKDDDCDGVADQGLTVGGAIELMFIIDNSGSMSDKVAAVNQAVSNFSKKYQKVSAVRWGLITAPDQDFYKYGDHPHLYKDMGDALSFMAAVSAQMGTDGSGNEPTLDAVFAVCSPTNPLQVSWAPGKQKIAIVFTDEPPQSYGVPKFSGTGTISQLCKDQKVPVYVFTNGATTGGQWQPLCDASYGICFDLYPYTIPGDLENLVSDLTCQ